MSGEEIEESRERKKRKKIGEQVSILEMRRQRYYAMD